MKSALAAFAVGFVFALGLGISGMTQPQKVVGFLDLFGAWDPALIFVMIGAISVHFVLYKVIRKKNRPVFSAQWHVPTSKEITPALLVGSTVFGIGWGLGGFCPGPAVTALASLQMRPLIFVFSMVAGMFIYRQADKRWKFRR